MECPHCGQSWNDGERCPRILYCGHIFCETCLRSWLKDGTSITCEICSKATSVHQGDLNYLIPVKHLAEAQKSSNDKVEGDQARRVDNPQSSPSTAADSLDKSFSPPKRAEPSGHADTADPIIVDSAGADAAGQPGDVSALSTGKPHADDTDEPWASNAADGTDVGQQSTVEADVETTSSSAACGTVLETRLSDVPTDDATVLDCARKDLSVESSADTTCWQDSDARQDLDGKQLTLGPQGVSADENPWNELIEHSAAIVEHTVGAVVCVAQGLAEADRQLGISNAVVDGVVGITRRVSGTLAPDPALTGDASRTNQDSGGSAVCVVS